MTATARLAQKLGSLNRTLFPFTQTKIHTSMTKTKREIAFDASMKVLLAVLSAASIFAFAFTWAAANGDTSFIKEAEAGFNLSALKLVVGAALLFIVIAAIAGLVGKDHDGRTRQRAALLVLEYVDDIGGVLGSAGGVAVFLAWTGKGATFGW